MESFEPNAAALLVKLMAGFSRIYVRVEKDEIKEKDKFGLQFSPSQNLSNKKQGKEKVLSLSQSKLRLSEDEKMYL